MKIPFHIIEKKRREQDGKRRRDEESMRVPLIPPSEDLKIHKGPPEKKPAKKVVVIQM